MKRRRARKRRNPTAGGWLGLAALAAAGYLVWRFGVSKALAQQDESTAQRPPTRPPTGPTTPDGLPGWAAAAEEGA